jgi:hypothetical protein
MMRSDETMASALSDSQPLNSQTLSATMPGEHAARQKNSWARQRGRCSMTLVTSIDVLDGRKSLSRR